MGAAEYDAVIIGGGHNGLTCGAYLARAGRKVLVLERRPLSSAERRWLETLADQLALAASAFAAASIAFT